MNYHEGKNSKINRKIEWFCLLAAKNTTFSNLVGFNFATSRIYNVVRILCHSLTCMQRGIIMFTMFSVISFPYMLSVMPESNHRFLNFVHTLLFEIIIILYYVEIRMIQLLIFVFWKYKKKIKTNSSWFWCEKK